MVIPVKFTVNSIFEDLMKNPKAMAVLKPIVDGIVQGMGGGGTDAANDAISSDMLQAMIRYMPLRTVASFSGGAITYDQLCTMVDMINQN